MVVGWEEELLLKKMKVMEVGRLMVVAAGKSDELNAEMVRQHLIV